MLNHSNLNKNTSFVGNFKKKCIKVTFSTSNVRHLGTNFIIVWIYCLRKKLNSLKSNKKDTFVT